MIIDLLNFNKYYHGTEADILFRMQEEGISVPSFFCITDDFTEDELNSYLQNHFQYTNMFSIRLSLSFENSENNKNYSLPDAADKLPAQKDIPKSALAYSAEKLFSQAQDVIKANYNDQSECISVHVIVQEAMQAEIYGSLHTACSTGLMNETVVYARDNAFPNFVNDFQMLSIYCHNNTDGVLFAHEPEGAVKVPENMIKKIFRLSDKIKKSFGFAALEVNFIIDFSENKAFIISVARFSELDIPGEDEVILDTRGVCNYYPGVTEPLYASTATETSAHIIGRMLKRINYTGPEPYSKKGILEYVNGRLYFNTKRMQTLQDKLYLTDESEKYIDPSIKNFAVQIKECGSVALWFKKKHTASKVIKLLEENLKQSKTLCSSCHDTLKEISSHTERQSSHQSIEKILEIISECISSNQLNTLYININRKMTKRLRPTERKYAKAEQNIAKALLYREELRRYHYSFIKFLRLHILDLGRQLVEKGILEHQLDISMLTYDELIMFLKKDAIDPEIKNIVSNRKKEFEWYKSMPNFSRLVFHKEAVSAPVGKVDFVCTISEKSHIRGCGLNAEKAKFPAVICKDGVLPKKCDPQKIYVVERFIDFSESKHIGGLIIMQQPILFNMNPDTIKVGFPIICGAEHAASVIHDGDIVSMDGANGEIFIDHK